MRFQRVMQVRILAIGIGIALTAAAAVGVGVTDADAQPYDIAWHAPAGGGTAIASGGPYTVTGTAGQPDASLTLTGGPYSITGGFWVVSGSDITPPAGDADLSITLNENVDPVEGNQPLVYTIVVANNGPAAASAPNVAVALAPGFVFTVASGAGWTCHETSGVVSCTRAALASVTTAPPISIIVTAPASAGGPLTSTATVQATENDPVPANNTSSATTTITPAPPTPAPRTYYLTEGATGPFFESDVLLANPNNVDAPIGLTFFTAGGSTIDLTDTLPAMSRKTIVLNKIAGLESVVGVSTRVTSPTGLPLVVERTMLWDRTGYGAHGEKAVDAPARRWYFAEGSQGFFHTYLLLANPNAMPMSAQVQYLREFEPPLTRTYPLDPLSRLTVDAGADTELINRSFGMIVDFDQPGLAERAMYFGDGTSRVFGGGHDSAGEPALSETWFLAEGATGPFFETFVLIANPKATDALVDITFLPSTGVPVTKRKTVPANRRLTINIEQEDPSLANAAVSTQVVSSQPIIVERSQYWPDPATSWYESHNSAGVTALGRKWGLAEGRVGSVDGLTNAQTFILLANPGSIAAQVQITFLRENGAAPVTQTFTVQPTSRFNVNVGSDVNGLANEQFGALIVSDQPIAVERALYWDAGNQVWAAGTNAAATRVP
jgi:uncharacterized repeat protein (TIGR01451 family)